MNPSFNDYVPWASIELLLKKNTYLLNHIKYRLIQFIFKINWKPWIIKNYYSSNEKVWTFFKWVNPSLINICSWNSNLFSLK
jgi:hypothetical protein